ncbi:hypothetical protein BU23DRAFT_469303 [Bimuria novae-zelandiae CBS 107.79]|uniref:Protein NO VEIN C-terminal domain-containing protein n=1 Tax=Bimuria novae-zelandiae CBS 107.79 TaxID=1447943 RepID=A0A6A5V3G3_9PLEO|nr:hypothetical protein BU23DRAFT_469303 [Bimuria novae-zelandiae CBS 107.79]
MYALRNCLWRSPFPLSGFIEVSLVYPNLENFFVKRLGVEKANPAMLIEEIKKLAKGSSPQIENIRQRLLGISRLLLKSGINDAVAKALTGLAKVKFLPQITRDGGKVLVGKDDDFVINDHQRFGDAFESQYILLDFSVEEVHVLNTVFDYMGFGVRYLSRAVKEASAVGEDAVEDESLTSAFRSRAYALYCHELWELDDILFEQDISAVGWIAKPTYESPGALLEHHVGVPGQPEREVSTALSSGTTRFTPPIIESLRERSHVFDTPPVTSTPQPPRYERLIEEVVQSAHRAREQQQHFSSSPLRPHISTPTHNQPAFEYNHEETFGNRDTNEVAHDIRIGASGESYVYEILSGLNLPGFSIDNWRSRIRGELRIHSRYAAVTNWQGRETADFVYTDRDGSLTQYLAENCSGGMPERVLDARPQGMAPKPIEYYLEVKTTTSRCDTRFYMSGSQYQRMENYAIPATGSFDKVYVILRVYNLGQNTGMRIFVDPHRLRGSHIDFEIATYHCKTKTAV